MDESAALTELRTPYSLGSDQIEHYQADGYIKLKHVLSPSLLAAYNTMITDEVMRLFSPAAQSPPNSSTDTYTKAFRQVMNLWVQHEGIKQIVFSERLAAIATALMKVDGVRLYHDQALYKMEHGGITPWHADQYYWPLSNNNTCTVWIPLQAVPMETGPLSFARGSHKINFHRDLPISDESDRAIQTSLSEAGLPYDSAPFDIGEVSFHSGWTMHNAPGNSTTSSRKAMTIIYMEDGIELVEPANVNQQADWETWMPGARVGEAVDTELNPVLYSK